MAMAKTSGTKTGEDETDELNVIEEENTNVRDGSVVIEGLNKTEHSVSELGSSQFSQSMMLSRPSRVEDADGEGKLRQITINEKVFMLGLDAQRDQELLQLQKIAENESGQMQFKKQGICAFLIVCVILMNILEPSSSEDSPIGIKMCGPGYWALELFFIAICVVMTWVAIKISSAE